MAMAKPNDAELAAYVAMHKCCVEEKEGAVVAKAEECMHSIKASPNSKDDSPAEDAQQIAEDALGLLFNFEEIGAEIGLTNDAEFKKLWDESHQAFRDALQEAVKLAEDSKKYMQRFNEQVVQRFSEGNVDWEKDKDLIANFIKDDEGKRLMEQSRKASQMFVDLKYAIGSFEEMYGDKTTEKGKVYNTKLKQIDDDRRRVQSQIDSNRASSTQLRSSMRRTTGCLLVRIVRAICSFLGIGGSRTFNQANGRLAELERQEQDLVRQRAAIDQRAAAMVKEGSALTQTRHAMSVVVDNVGDMSGRFNSLAQSWSDTTFHFERMGELLQYASEEKDQKLFMGHMRLIGDSTPILTSNLEAWTNGIAPGGVLAKPKKKASAYDISDNYGGMDGVAFNDSRPELDPAMSVHTIKIVRGAGIDGLHVTYRLKSGKLQLNQHGADRNKDYEEVALKETEYINMASGKYVASGATNCVHQLTMQITDSTTGSRRTVGPYGTGAGLPGGASFTWTGRLLCFGGVAINEASSLGLRAIKFVQLKPKESEK